MLTTLDAAERFAIDYVKLGEDNFAFSGDRAVLTNHHAYGADVLAVADGVIMDVQDGIPDRVGPPLPSYPFVGAWSSQASGSRYISRPVPKN